MTFDELLSAILNILPEATLGEDNEGQIIIYTNLHQHSDSAELVSFDAEELERRLSPDDE